MRLEGQKEKRPEYVSIPSVVFLAGAAAMVALLCPWLQVFSGLFLFYPIRLSGGGDPCVPNPGTSHHLL